MKPFPVPSASLLKKAIQIPSPSYLIEERVITENCKILQEVAQNSGAKIVLAQKAFAQPQLYPLIGTYLNGACASGLWEAKLARDHFPPDSEIITCSPAYRDAEMAEILNLSQHLDFNSLSQWKRYKEQSIKHKEETHSSILFGLRINPEHSTGMTTLYDPCAQGSRLGVTYEQLNNSSLSLLKGISGLHFHTLCEQGYSDLESTVDAVEKKFGKYLKMPQIQYLNLGGGHWITKPDYDRTALVKLIRRLSEQYQLQIYLEPGEAVVIHSGILVATILDLHRNGNLTNAILDVSATAHMPDVLEMPYRPNVYALKNGEWGQEHADYSYRLTGNTCLAGDQIGDYAFTKPLVPEDRLFFDDMGHYTMVKTSFFNGVQHPSIYLLNENQELICLKKFTYEDYKGLKI